MNYWRTILILGVVFSMGVNSMLLAQDATTSTPPASSDTSSEPSDSMSTYRDQAKAILDAYNAKDMDSAKSKCKELETSWDKNTKELKKKQKEAWKKADKDLDAFIDPLLGEKPLDDAKVQPAYDSFVASLSALAKG